MTDGVRILGGLTPSARRTVATHQRSLAWTPVI